MTFSRALSDNDLWLRQIFASKAALTGGVVRRSAADVAWKVGRRRLELEIRRRGFRLVEAGYQLIVICRSDEIRVLV